MNWILKNKFILLNKETNNKMVFGFKKSKQYSKTYKINSYLISSEQEKITQEDIELVSSTWYTDDAISFVKNNDYYNYDIGVLKC